MQSAGCITNVIRKRPPSPALLFPNSPPYSYASAPSHRSEVRRVGDIDLELKFQALVYGILPPTTAIVHYAIGLEKLSANEQFFGDAQTTISL